MKQNYDLVFNALYARKDLDRNTLFIFWDILRCMDGGLSCIELHNRVAKELRRQTKNEN